MNAPFRSRDRIVWWVNRPALLTRDCARVHRMTNLFTPIKLRGVTFDNRIVLSPMCQYAAQDGNPSDWHMAHLGSYALANLGLVITEAAAVEPVGRISPMCLGLYSGQHQEGLARIIKFFREFSGSKFGVQLAHAGRKSS